MKITGLVLVAFVAAVAAAASAPFDFLPLHKGSITRGGGAVSWKGSCFGKTTASLEGCSDEGTCRVTVEVSKPRSLLCADRYVVVTEYRFQPAVLVTRGRHTVTLKLKEHEDQDIAVNGIQFYEWTHSDVEVASSLVQTLRMLSGSPSEEQIVEFLHNRVGYTLEPRATADFALDEKFIQSGDQLAINRLDGSHSLILWGTGGRTGHTAVFLWMDGELFVTESKSETKFWPAPHGVIRTPYRQWLTQARAANYMVDYLPLSNEARAKFNEDAAVAFFRKHEGTPYGHPNYLMGFLDVPDKNIPYPATPQIALSAMVVGERFVHKKLDAMFAETMNHRLGTAGLDFAGVLEEIARRNESFWDVVSQPERDAWVYKQGLSMVCNVYVQRVYEEAGVFGDLAEHIEATEHTPKDTYMLRLYRQEYSAGQDDPQCETRRVVAGTGTVCQIMGKYDLELPGYNTIEPYAGMNERCPSWNRDGYARPDGC